MSRATFDEARLVQGDEASRRAAREELRRLKMLNAVESSSLPRLDRDALRFEPFEIVLHETSGQRYKLSHGDTDGAIASAHAWFIERGEPRLLERIR